MRRGKRKALDKSPTVGAIIDKLKQTWTRIRAKDGASVSCDQAAVRSCQGALPGPGQEHGAPHDAVRAEQSVDGAQMIFKAWSGYKCAWTPVDAPLHRAKRPQKAKINPLKPAACNSNVVIRDPSPQLALQRGLCTIL